MSTLQLKAGSEFKGTRQSREGLGSIENEPRNQETRYWR